MFISDKLGMLYKLFVYTLIAIILRNGVSGSETGSVLVSSSQSCNDQESCMAVHLDNQVLRSMISNRCKLEAYSKNFDSNRHITFTHLPKTGGSSVSEELSTMARKRVQHSGHEHFIQTHLADPENIFVTMLREPVSRAISYYAYVQQVNRLDREKRKNKLWMGTHHAPAVKWASNTFIQTTLATDPLGFFLTDVKNIEDNISRFNFTMLHHLPRVALNDAVPGTLQEFLHYTASIPAAYQCRNHLQVAFILLKQYEVVGTLEKRTDFYETLFRRAQLRNVTASVHGNKTSYKLTKEEKEEMKRYLTKPLYCGRVLWEIAGRISDADMKCA